MSSEDEAQQTVTPLSDTAQTFESESTPRRRTTHACDRCRTRKARCDSKLPRCGSCAYANVPCTFDIPKLRRGPKANSQRFRLRNRGSAPPASEANLPDPVSVRQPPVASPTSATGLSEERLLTLVGSPNTLELPISPRGEISSPHIINGRLSPGIRKIASALLREMSQMRISFRDYLFHCLDLYAVYQLPLVPIVDMQTLGRDAEVLCAELNSLCNALDVSPGGPSPSIHSIHSANEESDIATNIYPLDQTFALLTAVAAYIAHTTPEEIYPDSPKVGPILLRASRNSLSTYIDIELEQLSSTSIVIRYLQSAAFHGAGRRKASFYTLGEAIRISQVLQLDNEASYLGLDDREADMRRRIFWILNTADKSGSFLASRPVTIEDMVFTHCNIPYPEERIVKPWSSREGTRVDGNEISENRSILTGFNYNQKLWRQAHELLLDIAFLSRRVRNGIKTLDIEYERLNEKYILFITCLDDAPPWLQSPTIASALPDGGEGDDKRFAIQSANLYVSYHCLRMKIAKELNDLSIANLGESAPPVGGYSVRITEIARDMMQVICTVPIIYLKINGESCIEKIRLIGANLLELIHREPESALGRRAKADIDTLLNILARLDSKASLNF